jgi:hemoglobin
MNSKPLPLCQALSRDQVAAVVHHFYQRVLNDELLAPFFAEIREWPPHEEYITDFWWGVMGGHVESPRPGAMVSGHQGLGITQGAVERWLALFAESIDELIPPAEAQQWQAMARGIATMMGEQGLVEREE